MSILREVVLQLAVRDRSAPGLPFYLSEWGWDSAGAGETCDFSQCVSERAQALYAVRSALMLQRLGVQRMSWVRADVVESASHSKALCGSRFGCSAVKCLSLESTLRQSFWMLGFGCVI